MPPLRGAHGDVRPRRHHHPAIAPVVPGAAGIHAPNTRARTATTGPPSRPVGAGPGTRGNRVAIAPGTIQTIPFLWWPRDAAVPAPASVRDAGRGRHECRPALVRDASRGRHECRPYARGGLAAARPTGTAARTGRRALTLVTAASSSLSPSCLLRMPWLS